MRRQANPNKKRYEGHDRHAWRLMGDGFAKPTLQGGEQDRA